ncbi:MAG: hypothetical protein QXL17_04745 [Candidatus Thermoplasmatota archaeon]
MQEIIVAVLDKITGLWTLPWILIGFLLTILFAKISSRERIDAIMKKVGLILLYFFVPILLFRIFLNTPFTTQQLAFTGIVAGILIFMYVLAFLYARYTASRLKLNEPSRTLFLKTVLTNQGRSSAFIGGAMLAISEWSVPAAINMALVGIGLFAVIPYILSNWYKREHHQDQQQQQLKTIKALPWFLKLYPWYLLSFVVLAILLHQTTGLTTKNLGDAGLYLQLYTAITIPAALYYVGAGIHPSELTRNQLKKLLGKIQSTDSGEHMIWVRKIFLLTVVITPCIIACIFVPLYILNIISGAWLSVILINSFLPVTSTNMFLVPYGIDKKTTAHVVTWTTIVCVPIVVLLIYLFSQYLS